MAGNSFGTIFRITTFGESHGAGIGVVIDGCPPGIRVDQEQIGIELARRRPGQSAYVTQRDESDHPEILSGTLKGKSTGAPIAIFIHNRDARPQDYEALKSVYRPSHADFTYEAKFGTRDHRGAGRASARETAARVAAGAVAKAFLSGLGIDIIAYVEQIGSISMHGTKKEFTREMVESTPVRCPDTAKAAEMMQFIEDLRAEGDSTGGIIYCAIRNCPPGLGDPVFDRLEADLAKAMLSINATKGFSIGSGFQGASMRGSEHNDPFKKEGSRIITKTNFSGGVQGGISNGMEVYFRVAFKPVSTIGKTQETLKSDGKATILEAKGRHDPCVVPRAVPIVEAMAALVLADHVMRQRALRPDKEQ